MAETYYEWALFDDENFPVAGGIASDAETAQREALQYLGQYGRGSRLEVRRVEIIIEVFDD